MALRPDLPRVTRFAITPPATSTITLAPVDRNLAISPNGSQIVYVGNNSAQVFRWPLDQLEPEAGASV